MKLVRENINFERKGDPKGSMGVGDPWILGLKSSKQGVALMCTMELFGNREIVPANAPKNTGADNWQKGKDWDEKYVRWEFPFHSEQEFKEVKNLYKERMNRPWPGSLSLIRTDRYGIYKTFRFDWLLDAAYKKAVLKNNDKNVFGDINVRSTSIGHYKHGYLDLYPGITYKEVFDFAGETFLKEINK